MEVILCQDVPKLGKVGKVVKVKDGFARNFLLPRRLAYLATPSNLRIIEQQKAKLVAESARIRRDAEGLAEKLSKVSCNLVVEVNDLEKLYGSVTDVDIVRVLKDEGFEIEKRNILLEKPIEDLGIYEVGVKVHPEVTAKIRLWVTKK